MLHFYGERVLPFDVSASRVARELTDKARAAGHLPDFADVVIAATVGYHGMTTLTRNLRPFTPLDIPPINPFPLKIGWAPDCCKTTPDCVKSRPESNFAV